MSEPSGPLPAAPFPAASFPPIAQLVPHEPPMLLIDELLAWTRTTAKVRAKVRAGGPFVVGERMPATILLEYMAQAIAAATGMRDHVDGVEGSELGLLLGTRELDLRVAELAVGDELELEVAREFDDGKLARYACTAARRGEPEPLARATINVMLAAVSEVS